MRYLVLTVLAMLGAVEAARAEPCAVEHLDWLKGARRAEDFSDNPMRDREGHDLPMRFRFMECHDRSAVPDGEGKNAGEHLTYRRLAERQLQVIGDSLHDGKPDHEEFMLRKVEN